MAKLTAEERKSFESIMLADLAAVDAAFNTLIKNFWTKARDEVIKERGWDTLIEEKETLRKQIAEMTLRIHKIEDSMHTEQLRPEQVMELGGNPNEFGRYGSAMFYGIPITSQFEYDVAQFIKQHVNLEVPVKFLRDLGRSCLRELAMSGTFEEAREAYEKFYALDFKKYGVDIPPRLREIKEHKLIKQAKDMLQLENKDEV